MMSICSIPNVLHSVVEAILFQFTGVAGDCCMLSSLYHAMPSFVYGFYNPYIQPKFKVTPTLTQGLVNRLAIVYTDVFIIVHECL